MKVLFFARLRQLNNADSIVLDDAVAPSTVAELRQLLRKTASPELAQALADENVFCAVNQRVVDAEFTLKADDEIAFFPPMTGG